MEWSCLYITTNGVADVRPSTNYFYFFVATSKSDATIDATWTRLELGEAEDTRTLAIRTLHAPLSLLATTSYKKVYKLISFVV